MRISLISIFPEIFESFLSTSLVAKAQERGYISVTRVDPRSFCTDRQQQVDDQPYGGGPGMLMKAQPIIDAVRSVVSEGQNFRIIFLSPSPVVFKQRIARELAAVEHLILVAGRYEGIDHRFEEIMVRDYGEKFGKISLGEFVTLGWEAPTMVMLEAVIRLLPGVIHDEGSHQDESYVQGSELEYPHYTRPEVVEGISVPEVLLSGHHKKISERREGMKQ